MVHPIVQPVLYQQVADRLRQMIQEGDLPAGSWIDEVRLTQILGISRTPLREALKVLDSEGLVRLEPRRGCFVNELSIEDLNDIFPLMAMLEGRCAFEAARKATATSLIELEPLHARLQAQAKQGDIKVYYALNAEIHMAIQALADNRWLSELIDSLRNLLSLSRYKSLQSPGRLEESCAEHLAIFEAIKQRDGRRAQEITEQHLMRQLSVLHELAQAADTSEATTENENEPI